MFEPILPLKVLTARKGEGSFIFIDMICESTKQIYKLWIYLCNWDLLKNDNILLSSSDTDIDKYNLQLSLIDKLSLSKISEVHEDDDTIIQLVFSDNSYLELYSDPNYKNNDNFFMLFLPKNEIVKAYSLEKGLYTTK